MRNALNKDCWFCGKTFGLHKHEIYFGTSNRKLSIKYGMVVYLCQHCHQDSRSGVHFNRKNDLELKKWGQARFQELHPELSFIDIFGRNYLGVDL